MDLTTRCPRCGTIFQASLPDLQLRKGYIRCIQCSHIFDGYAEVVSDTPDAAAAAADRVEPVVAGSGEPLAAESPWLPPPDDVEHHDAVVPHVFRSGREAPPRADAPVMIQPQARDEPQAWLAGPPEPLVVEARPGYRGLGGTAAPLLEADQLPSWWSRLVRFSAGVLLFLLMLLAGAQLVYVYRAQIAQAVPVLRPWLEQACIPLRCRVAYARNIAEIEITGSALQVQDATPQAPRQGPVPAAGNEGAAPAPGAEDQTPQHFMLQLTLRNRADRPQEWPTLVLDLKDGAGTPMVRRNLSPVDYLGPDAAKRPFPAHGDVLVRVPLTLTGLRINGYQLDLFFP